MRIDKNTTIRLGNRNIVKIKIGDSVIWQKTTGPVVGPDYFYIESLGDGNTISLKNKGDGSTDNVTPTLEYSTDKNTWNTITFDWTNGNYTTELPVTLNTGEKMYFRNDTRKFSGSYNKYITFSSSVSSNVGGDIRTLSNYLDVNNETTVQSYMFYDLFYNNKNIVDVSNLRLPYTTLADGCYSGMFLNCTSLTTAPIELPATTLKYSCYQSMFEGCTSLTTAPIELPATKLAIYCYSNMFLNCTSLTTAPTELPATTTKNYCYSNMFTGCTSLTAAPALPATTLANSCYSYMFKGCTKLTTAPELPATKLAIYCYSGMFSGCKSLTSAPALPATTLADYCYSDMFINCTSLTTAPIELPATTLAIYCYQNMFSGCSKLTSAPALPATTLADYCYNNMFEGCKSLTTAPKLPATTLAKYCYQGMFSGCTSLTTAPALPATTLADDCYSNMFLNCTSLTTAPALPATTLKPICYGGMFNGCTGLTTAPELPATTTKDYCYSNMFNGCTSLTAAPALPATTLANGCYSGMFSGCTSLTATPALPATTTKKYCYQSMFQDCTSLNSITVYANDVSATDCTSNWLSNVASTGTFHNLGSATYTTNSPSGIPSGWTEVKPVVGPDYFYIESLGDGNTISVKNVGNGSTDNVTPTLEYSTDKNTWNTITFDWTSGNHTTELPVKLNTGGKMYFRNDTHKFSNDYNKYISFSSTVSSNVGGDIRTLSNYLDVDSETTPQTYMFYYLFYDNKYIVDASNLRLPYTTLAGYCYINMFRGCTSLTTAPSLPATTLASNCYNRMFQDCTGLTSAPTLPATTLESWCYSYMFQGCTSLTTAPALPATTLADYCYYYMFNGCNSLTSVTIYATSTANNSFDSWLDNVAPSGTVYNNGLVDLPENSASGVPSGWTEVVPPIQSITANPDTFTIEFNNETVTCKSTLEVVTTMGTLTNTNSVTLTVGENTGNTTRTLKETIPYYNSSYDVTIVQSAIQSITANPDTFTIKSYKDTVKCNSTLTIATTIGTTVTDTNTATITVGENTGDTTRTLTETIPYKSSSYQVTIVQTANDVKPTVSWNVVSTGTYPFELNTNGYYESTNKGQSNSYSYATLNYEGFENLVLECINSGEPSWDYGIISQPDVQLSESYNDDGLSNSTNVFYNFSLEHSTNPVQLTIPSDGGSHFITIKYKKDGSGNKGNDSLQFKVIEP